MCRYLSAKECGAYESLYNPVGVGIGVAAAAQDGASLVLGFEM